MTKKELYMEIHASAKWDFDSIKAFTRLNTFLKLRPLYDLIISLSLGAVLFLELLLLAALHGFSGVIIVCMVSDALLCLLECYRYFILPIARYKGLGKMQNTVNEYVFCDHMVRVSSVSDVSSGSSEFSYDMLRRVAETSRYFFLFPMNNVVCIVDKSTFTPGEANVLRDRIIAIPGVKYVPYKY